MAYGFSVFWLPLSRAIGIDNLQIASEVVPEPSTIALFGLGIAALGAAQVRRRRKFGHAQ